MSNQKVDSTQISFAAGGALNVQEIDGAPSVANVDTIVVSNGTLTDDGGGQVTIATGGGGADANAVHVNASGEISAITAKATPVDADVTIIEDSAAGNAKKSLSWVNIKATLKTYFDSLYSVLGHTHTGLVTNGDSHDHSGGDGAQIVHSTLGSIGANDHHNQSHDHSAAGDGQTLSPATLIIPISATPAQTAEGSAVWDSNDDTLTVGDGSARKEFGYLGSSTPQNLGTAAAGTSKEVSHVDHVHNAVTGTLEVKEVDGAPDVSNVTQIIVSNGTLTDNGAGSVSITTGGGGAGSDTTAVHDDTANEISAITEKTTLADDDIFLIEDSAASYVKKKVKKSNLGASSPNHAFYTYKAALLEPLAIEAAQVDSFSYAIAAGATKIILASYQTRLGSGGRWEVRDPFQPAFLRGVTLAGLATNSTAAIIDPTLPTYTDARDTYFDRLQSIAETQTQYLALTATNTVYTLLPGPYGIIITGVNNFDFAWLAMRLATNRNFNLANEVGDTTIQRNWNGLFLPASKDICNGILTSSTGTSPLGGITYVILPSSWGAVADATSYDFRDDFMDAVLDTVTKWSKTESTGGNVAINTAFQWCKLIGNSAWNTNGLISQPSIARATGKIFQCDVNLATADANVILGFHDGAGVADTDFAHGVQMRADGFRYIKEDGNVRENGATSKFSQYNTYRLRITIQNPNTGAKYEMQGLPEYAALGGAAWTDITPGTTSSSTTPLYAGIAVFSGTVYISDVKIY